MRSPDGITDPIWNEKAPAVEFDQPRRSATVDVCVVGAGIAGLTSAYLLVNEGKSVIVIDEGPVGGGQTGRTSAHLASAIDDRFTEIEKYHGKEGSRLAYESHAAAIDLIEQISKTEGIECEFRRLDAFLSPVESAPPDLLDEEFAAAKRAGFAAIELVKKGGLDGNRCIRFGNQARFHPMLYLIGLAKAIKRKGGTIYTGRRVIDVQGADRKSKSPAQVQMQGIKSKISASHVVVATNTPAPINDWFGIYTKQASYRSYMIGATLPRNSVADALYWDTADPYHYVRLEKYPGNRFDVLLVGGEDHKVGQFPDDAAPFMKLESWARQKFPMIRDVKYRWSGQVQEPDDGLAYIGRALTAKEEVFVITGDSGMGLTHGTLGARIVSDLIAGRSNPWEKLYDPSRKTLNVDFVKENANTMKQYADLLTGGEVKSDDEIRPGYGAVMREGMSKVAVYRDDGGKVHRCSAICTHLGCVVQWNHVERSWDCPCHGSRFDPTGKVLMGPAIDDLPKVKS